MKRLLVFTLAATLGAAALGAPTALAQRNANELLGVEQAAMEAYHNLELDEARDLLEGAIDEAEDNDVAGAALAKAYVSLGIVYVGGFTDTARGRDLFVKGLQADSGVELDPTFSTPDIAAVFDQARSQVFGSAPRAEVGGSVEGNLKHTPVSEQLAQAGVPVFVEVPGNVQAQTLRIFYRSLGMREPASADMSPMDGGFGYTIPCDDVYEPTVEYFVVAIDSDGQQVGNAGTPRAPVVVPIVTTRTSAPPSLPGQPPPRECGDGGGGAVAAAPTTYGGSGGGLGDTCGTSSDCSSGLVCDDNFCAVDNRDRDEEERNRSRGDAPRWFVRVGGGLGLALVKTGQSTVSSPSGDYFQDLTPGISNPPTEADQALLAERAARAGYQCDFSQGTIDDCEAQLQKNGLFTTPAIRLEFGYFVTERLSLALTGRLQPGAPSGFLVGARAGYLLTEAKEKGFQPSLFAGFQVGRIQPQLDINPPALMLADGTLVTEDAPFVESGIAGVNLGVHLGYRFIRNFGMYLSPELDLMFPDFLFNIDLTAGLEVAF